MSKNCILSKDISLNCVNIITGYMLSGQLLHIKCVDNFIQCCSFTHSSMGQRFSVKIAFPVSMIYFIYGDQHH